MVIIFWDTQLVKGTLSLWRHNNIDQQTNYLKLIHTNNISEVNRKINAFTLYNLITAWNLAHLKHLDAFGKVDRRIDEGGSISYTEKAAGRM